MKRFHILLALAACIIVPAASIPTLASARSSAGLMDRYAVRKATHAIRAKTVKKPVRSQKIAGDILSFGEESAPVTITEYTDYECPFCRRFHSGTFPQIKKDYIDTGKVRFVIKQFPLAFHAGALPAAMAVQCALDQGNDIARKVSDAMWVLQDAGNELKAVHIKKYATIFQDIDAKAFSDCFDNEKKQDVITAQIKEGETANVSGTPTFILTTRDGRTKTIAGAMPYASFQDAIDSLLK